MTEPIVFPVVMKYIHPTVNLVVEFKSETVGVILEDSGDPRRIGKLQVGFYACTNTDRWEPVEDKEE